MRSPGDNNEIEMKDMAAAAALESDGHATKSEHVVPELEQNPSEDDAKVPGKEEFSEPEPEQKIDATIDKEKVRTQNYFIGTGIYLLTIRYPGTIPLRLAFRHPAISGTCYHIREQNPTRSSSITMIIYLF